LPVEANKRRLTTGLVVLSVVTVVDVVVAATATAALTFSGMPTCS
jgi:hypothetical protein